MADTGRLSGLRDSIADVVRALLKLLRWHMTLTPQIGHIKAEPAEPVVVLDVGGFHSALTLARRVLNGDA
jgi:chorismate mutase